jgi:hypothetical protein
VLNPCHRSSLYVKTARIALDKMVVAGSQLNNHHLVKEIGCASVVLGIPHNCGEGPELSGLWIAVHQEFEGYSLVPGLLACLACVAQTRVES